MVQNSARRVPLQRADQIQRFERSTTKDVLDPVENVGRAVPKSRANSSTAKKIREIEPVQDRDEQFVWKGIDCAGHPSNGLCRGFGLARRLNGQDWKDVCSKRWIEW
jgi:hypothetical protein